MASLPLGDAQVAQVEEISSLARVAARSACTFAPATATPDQAELPAASYAPF